MKKLTNKVFIQGFIHCITGLRIGGNKSSLEIGGVDLNIIKNAGGRPYIPGSSLKGKLRSLLAKLQGWEKAENDQEPVKSLFGGGGGKEANTVTRLFVRDAPLEVGLFNKRFPDKSKRDFEYSETKTENVIDRSTGKAQHPRNIERVPADAVFKFQIVIDVYEEDDMDKYINTVCQALELLQYDYLGGHGSRGSGKVRIEIEKIEGKSFSAGTISDMTDEKWKDILARFPVTTTEEAL